MIYYYHQNGRYTAFGTGPHLYIDLTTEERERFQSFHNSFRKESITDRPYDVWKCPFIDTTELLDILFREFLTKDATRRATEYGVTAEQMKEWLVARGK